MLEENGDDNKTLNPLRPKSCLIIPKEPVRGGEKPKVQPKTNQHIIIEFALQVRLLKYEYLYS